MRKVLIAMVVAVEVLFFLHERLYNSKGLKIGCFEKLLLWLGIPHKPGVKLGEGKEVVI